MESKELQIGLAVAAAVFVVAAAAFDAVNSADRAAAFAGAADVTANGALEIVAELAADVFAAALMALLMKTAAKE